MGRGERAWYTLVKRALNLNVNLRKICGCEELWPGAMTYAGLVFYTMAARSNSPRPQATNLSIVSDRSGETTPTWQVLRRTQTEELHSKPTFQSWLVAIKKRPFPRKYSPYMLSVQI